MDDVFSYRKIRNYPHAFGLAKPKVSIIIVIIITTVIFILQHDQVFLQAALPHCCSDVLSSVTWKYKSLASRSHNYTCCRRGVEVHGLCSVIFVFFCLAD